MILEEKYSPEKVRRAKAAALFLGEPASEIVRNLIDDVLELQARVQELEQEREVDGLHDLIDEQDKQIKEMQKLINEQDKQIQKLFEAEQKWIPVSERLPEENVYVQVTDGFSDVFQAKMYLKYGEPKWVWQGYDVDIVTHWQPLPQPPKDVE